MKHNNFFSFQKWLENKYIQKHLNKNNFNYLLSIFTDVSQRLEQKGKAKLFNLLRNKSKAFITNNDYFRIYLFVLALFTVEPSLQCTAYYLFAKNLQNIKFPIQQSYCSEIHHHFVTVLYCQISIEISNLGRTFLD